MQLTMRLFGVEFLFVDLSEPEPERTEDRGYDCTTYPVGFSGPAAVPDMVALPDRE